MKNITKSHHESIFNKNFILNSILKQFYELEFIYFEICVYKVIKKVIKFINKYNY
jgi:hypothetical protein